MPEDLTPGDLSSPLLNIVNPTPDEHAITTPAVDTGGKVQPTADDLQLINKITYWESNGQIRRQVNIPA